MPETLSVTPPLLRGGPDDVPARGLEASNGAVRIALGIAESLFSGRLPLIGGGRSAVAGGSGLRSEEAEEADRAVRGARRSMRDLAARCA